jgi:hypothetical protein
MVISGGIGGASIVTQQQQQQQQPFHHDHLHSKEEEENPPQLPLGKSSTVPVEYFTCFLLCILNYRRNYLAFEIGDVRKILERKRQNAM